MHRSHDHVRYVSMPKFTVRLPPSNICQTLRLLISRPYYGRFPTDCLKELITMMSAEDRILLAELGPDLMESVIIDGSSLLARLRAKHALTDQQKETIQVIKQ